MKKSFEEWETSPSDDFFSRLDESLATERVWIELDQSLNAFKSLDEKIQNSSQAELNNQEEAPDIWERIENSLDFSVQTFDKKLRASYDQYTPELSQDLWGKIHDSISQENVWFSLEAELNKNLFRTSLGTWFGRAAMILFILSSSFYLRNEGAINQYTMIAWEVGSDFTSSLDQNGSQNLADIDADKFSSDISLNNLAIYNNRTDSQEQRTNNFGFNHLSDVNITEIKDVADKNANQAQQLVVENTELHDIIDLKSMQSSIAFGSGLTVLDRDDLAFDNRRNNPIRFGFEIGSQASLINDQQSSILSINPRAGLHVGMSLQKQWYRFDWTNRIAFTNYLQENGRYVRSGFYNATQRISCFQVTTGVGVRLRRLHTYAGLTASKMLFGNEISGSTITKVYEEKSLAMGYNLGVDYTLGSFGKRGLYAIGAEYSNLRAVEDYQHSVTRLQAAKLFFKISF